MEGEDLGRAVDIVFLDYTSDHQIALGNEVGARTHQLGAERTYPVVYTLWQQTYYPFAQSPTLMEDLALEPVKDGEYASTTEVQR